MTKVWVAVGSSNPCKVNAVRSAFEALYSTIDRDVEVVVTSHPAPSGVSDQPYGDAETKLGAVNRANAAWDDAARQTTVAYEGGAMWLKEPHFSVGLEGGVEVAPASTAGIMAAARSSGKKGNDEDTDTTTDVLWCMAWMAIRGTGSEICTMAKESDSSYTADKSDCSKTVWGFGKTGSFELPPEVARLVRGGMELGHADDKVFSRVNSKHGSGTVGMLTKGMIDRSKYYDHALKLALVPWIQPELYIE